MSTIQLRGPVNLETLADNCSGVNAEVTIGVAGSDLALTLRGEDTAGCVELLVDWLQISGIEVLAPVR